MAQGDAREGKWRGKMRMEWVASSLALYVGTRSIQLLSADPNSSAASSRLNWHPRQFKWARPFRWKTKSGFCACAITFRTCYTIPRFLLANRRNTRKARWERSLSRLRLEPDTSRILSISVLHTTFHLNQLTGLDTKIQMLCYDTPLRIFPKDSVFFSTEVCSNVPISDTIQWHYVIVLVSISLLMKYKNISLSGKFKSLRLLEETGIAQSV